MKRKKSVKKKLICFDLDNTLVHTDRAHLMAYTHALRKYGIKHITQKQLREKFGIVARVFLKELLPDASQEMLNKIAKEHKKRFAHYAKEHAHVIRGAKATIQQLKKTHELALTTNCGHRVINAIMQGTGLKKSWFTVIVGQDDVQNPKPAPDEILKAEHLAHVQADYMIGDSTYDILAARKARVKGIAVLTGNHTRSMLQKVKPYKIIKSVKDLPKILEKE